MKRSKLDWNSMNNQILGKTEKISSKKDSKEDKLYYEKVESPQIDEQQIFKVFKALNSLVGPDTDPESLPLDNWRKILKELDYIASEDKVCSNSDAHKESGYQTMNKK